MAVDKCCINPRCVSGPGGAGVSFRTKFLVRNVITSSDPKAIIPVAPDSFPPRSILTTELESPRIEPVIQMNEPEEKENSGLKDKISGLGQKIFGEIETIGGVLTGDPLTQAEGEFNVEVGTVREEIEDELEEPDSKTSE